MPTRSICLLALALVESGCAVEIESRVRRCTSSSPCAPGRACVDGLCVDPSQRVDPEGPCEAAELLDRPNLIGNGTFDRTSEGWVPFHATATQVDGGLSGLALQLQAPADQAEFGLNDSPSWVKQTLGPATRYCYSGWVRSERFTSIVRIEVHEYTSSGAAVATLYSQTTPLSPTWQRLRVDYVAQGAAGGSLDLRLEVDAPLTPAESLEVDELVLRVAP